MRDEEYWENRAAWDMYENMQKAEETSDDIAVVYLKSSRWLQLEMEGIFERYKTKHKLSEAEARRLLESMDGTTVREMLLKLKNGESDKSKKELLAELEAPAYQARISRLAELQNQIDAVMQNVYQQEKQISTAFYESLAENTYYRSVFETQKRTGLAFSFSHISRKQIDNVLSMNWSGRHYSKRIWNNTEKLAQTLKEEMLVSLLTGRTERETAELISNRFAQGASNARRLVRTESCFVSGEITAKAYEECEIEKYIFLATLDLRTSKICQSLDGKQFKLSERKQGKNYPPMHPWCRSTTLSDISEKVLSKLKRRAFNPSTGRTELVPASMTYDEWYKKYVENSQKEENEHEENTVAKPNISGIMEKNGDTLKMDLQLFSESDIKNQSSDSLKRAIRKYEKQIGIHGEKISHPEQYISDWDSLDPRMQEGLKRHWNKEIRNFNQSIQDRIEELKERGDYIE